MSNFLGNGILIVSKNYIIKMKNKRPVKLRMYDKRLACIVRLWPNIVNSDPCEPSKNNISVSLIVEHINTPAFVPFKSAGLRPASIIASIDRSKLNFVIMSIAIASFGWALKNIASKSSTFFIFPVPDLMPSSSVVYNKKVFNKFTLTVVNYLH